MLKRLIFVVDNKIELPVYQNETVLVTRVSQIEEVSELDKKNTIFVCDSSIEAAKLYKNGQNVVALLTDENQSEDFSFCKFAIMDAAACELDFFEGVLKRFLGLPWDILETDRCFVRETTVEDVDAFYELYKDEEITQYMEPLFEDRDEEIEYAKSYIKNVYEFYGFGMWTVVEKTSGKIIGRAGVSYREGYELPELGFMIGKAFWRRGYAYEVCCAILQYMYENYDMDELFIFIEPKNTPSIFFAKKLGAYLYKEQCMGTCDCYLMKLPLSRS